MRQARRSATPQLSPGTFGGAGELGRTKHSQPKHVAQQPRYNHAGGLIAASGSDDNNAVTGGPAYVVKAADATAEKNAANATDTAAEKDAAKASEAAASLIENICNLGSGYRVVTPLPPPDICTSFFFCVYSRALVVVHRQNNPRQCHVEVLVVRLYYPMYADVHCIDDVITLLQVRAV